MHAKFAKKMAQTETLRLKRQIFPCASALNFRETYDWADLHSGIFTYCPVHKCWPKTSWAGNQGNHQNFDPTLLPEKKCIFVFFACFRPYVGQPDNHIGWVTLMPLASIYPPDPRTNPTQFCEKILRIDGFEKGSFFESAILDFFCLIP